MPVRHLWRHNETSNLSSAYQIIHSRWFPVRICFESFAIPFVKCCIVDCEYNRISTIHCIWVFCVSAGTFSAFTGSYPMRLEHEAIITFFTVEKFHSIIKSQVYLHMFRTLGMAFHILHLSSHIHTVSLVPIPT